jgi:hypothetical protein
MPIKEQQFDSLSESLIRDEEARFDWLNSPNKEFYGMTPRELFKNDPDEAIALLRLLNCTGDECDLLTDNSEEE